jgi:hypothetical protein
MITEINNFIYLIITGLLLIESRIAGFPGEHISNKAISLKKPS